MVDNIDRQQCFKHAHWNSSNINALPRRIDGENDYLSRNHIGYPMGYIRFVVLHSSYAFQRTIHKTHFEFIVLSFRRFFSPSALSPQHPLSSTRCRLYFLCTILLLFLADLIHICALQCTAWCGAKVLFALVFRSFSVVRYFAFLFSCVEQPNGCVELLNLCQCVSDIMLLGIIFWSQSYVRSSHQ